MRSMSHAESTEAGRSPAGVPVTTVVDRARSAMAKFADSGQERVDEVVTALAWSLYKPEHARDLAELAVRTRSSRTAARPSAPFGT